MEKLRKICYNTIGFQQGVNDIKKNSSEYKIWKKRNDEKKAKQSCKRKNKKYKSKTKIQNNIEHPYKTFTVPKKFSIVNNPEETIKFFNSMIDVVEKIRKEIKENRNIMYFFKIDMKEVEFITGDALMYLLTVIKNTRGKKSLPVNWIGNFPDKQEIKEFLQASGYLEYMKTDKKNLKKTNEKIQIRTGKTYVYNAENMDIRKEVVDFTIQKLNKDKKELQFLFNILTEVITNIEHAYNIENELIFDPSWYIMVENDNDKIKYTFMDNGLGIPTTVKKKTFEEILKKFNIDKEYKYIKTALDGSYKRTQTEKRERSTGLPDVYEKLKSKKISNLIIVSNKAYYCENNPKDIEESLVGTVLCWEIEKERKV